MMRPLQEAARDDTATLMNQRITKGKTPQDLLEETRNRWQELNQRMLGAGRGRGQPVGI